MKITIKETKNIIVKSKIPSMDYVINPYIGCQHGCIYCYAEFMKRFSNHKGNNWGDFLDIKQISYEKIKPEKYNKKTILLSSVTDPYTPLELRYKNTRQILEKLQTTKANIIILTKSKYVTRDVDLFRRFENIEIGISLNTLSGEFAKKIEPQASSPLERIDALEEISKHGLETYIFLSPIFPRITNFKEIIEQTKHFTKNYQFENLNFRPHNISRIIQIIAKLYPELKEFYMQLKENNVYWGKLKNKIETYCKKEKLNYSINFHHGGFSKS